MNQRNLGQGPGTTVTAPTTFPTAATSIPSATGMEIIPPVARRFIPPVPLRQEGPGRTVTAPAQPPRQMAPTFEELQDRAQEARPPSVPGVTMTRGYSGMPQPVLWPSIMVDLVPQSYAFPPRDMSPARTVTEAVAAVPEQVQRISECEKRVKECRDQLLHLFDVQHETAEKYHMARNRRDPKAEDRWWKEYESDKERTKKKDEECRKLRTECRRMRSTLRGGGELGQEPSENDANTIISVALGAGVGAAVLHLLGVI